jgi:hypothetical protein
VIALALTPAAIKRLANVCLHSCRPIGSSPACLQAVKARLRTAVGVNGEVSLEPNTSPVFRRVLKNKAKLRGQRPRIFSARIVDNDARYRFSAEILSDRALEMNKRPLCPVRDFPKSFPTEEEIPGKRHFSTSSTSWGHWFEPGTAHQITCKLA